MLAAVWLSVLGRWHDQPLIQLDDLTLSHERHPAVHHLSGTFAPGSLTAVVGPNGAGKTTLLRAIAGLHRPGRSDRSWRAARGRDRPAATVERARPSFPIACLESWPSAHWGRAGAFRALSRAQRDVARAGAGDGRAGRFAERPVGSLSAGQFQRVLFARVLVQDAPVLLLDEPFNAVDERTGADSWR